MPVHTKETPDTFRAVGKWDTSLGLWCRSMDGSDDRRDVVRLGDADGIGRRDLFAAPVYLPGLDRNHQPWVCMDTKFHSVERVMLHDER
jgi:hypothetical protein